MAPVARALASHCGVLEPFQTALSLEGQIDELKTVLETKGDAPVTLIGFSWGAWLAFLLAAGHPGLVKKLILVSSGPFEEQYAAGPRDTRLGRLSEKEREEVEGLMTVLHNPSADDRNPAFARFGALLSKADAYDPVPADPDGAEDIDYRIDIFQGVWKDGAELRKSGKLLERGKGIECPVVAVHGDFDPHPAEGVEKPLAAMLKNFRFILLEKCGHKPWIEKCAAEEFFRVLQREIR
jgi:pimeloyl-ACP methyl ester carboxylesterase